MNEREKDQMEESLTNLLENSLSCVEMTLTGKIIQKDGFIITVETEKGKVKVNINDGTTDTKTFEIGDALTSLPIQGAYLDAKEENLVFIFEGPSS